MNTQKYKYLITASVLLFLALWGLYGLISSVFIAHNYCLFDIPSPTQGFLYSFAMLFRLISPFINLYVALVFIYLSKRPEKENLLTKISLWLTILFLAVQFSSYIPFIGMFVQILVYSNIFSLIFLFMPIIVFILLIIGNFNKYYFAICIGLAVLILGGIKISENRHGCSAGISNNGNSSKLEEAIKNNDQSQCSSLIPEQKQYCYREIALSKNDPNICGKMEDGADYSSLRAQKNGCYRAIAKNTSDSKICSLMLPEIKSNGIEEKDLCYTDVASKTKSVELCVSISNLRQKDICISAVALATNDLKICNLAINSDLPMKSQCITGIATANKNLKTCDLITSYNEKRHCVSEVAIVTDNCALMKQYGDVFYDSCLTLSAQYKRNNPN